MANSWFQFQEFRINQDRCAMKISTDAVLLGALAAASEPSRILDIGTGTGVVALMLAQRFPNALIEAVELDEDAAAQAGANFSESKFAERITNHQSSIQDFTFPHKFDLVVSNPPYFEAHLKGKKRARNQALHTDTLSYEELLSNVLRLISPAGVFWLILPPYQSSVFQKLAEGNDLFANKIFKIRDNPSKDTHREIVAFEMEKRDLEINEISIKNQNGSLSDLYSELVSGFLLHF